MTRPYGFLEPCAIDTPVLRHTEPDRICGAREPLTNVDWTWLDAEARFPECSAAWDRDGGPEQVGGRPGLTIVLGSSLAVGWGDVEPFGWALWHEGAARWIFLDRYKTPHDDRDRWKLK